MRRCVLLFVSFFLAEKERNKPKEKHADRLICTKFNLSG